MTREESDNVVPEVLFSPQTKKRYNRVMGFDFGSSTLNCSFSTAKVPASASIFYYWTNIGRSETLLPACIQYKNWSLTQNKDIKVGFQCDLSNSAVQEGDVYIKSIKQYVLQAMKGDADQDGPTASLVLSDFFKFVYAELSNASIKPNEKQKRPEAHSSSANKRQPTKPYSIDDCRFCFTVPDGLSNTLEYTDLIRAAFKQAGFLKKEDGDNRLIFVNDAVAAGYHCLTKPIFFRSINIDSNYLLVDLGYGLTKFSVIKAKKTEATSSVQSLSNVNGNVGYRGFSENFRNYLIKESETLGLDAANTEEIDKIVASFDAYKKAEIDLFNDNLTTMFEGSNGPINISNKDLREQVFNPYLDRLFDLICKECDANDIRQIIFRGQYCEVPFFYDKCNIISKADFKRRTPTFVIWEEPKYMVSHGAVSFGLRSASPQIPKFSTEKSLESDRSPCAKVAKSTTKPTDTSKKPKVIPKGYFAVGIDFGTTYSGASYADINTEDPKNKKTIVPLEKWHKSFTYPKASTALRYNENSGRFVEKCWGFDTTKPMARGDVNLEYFKLLLSPENVDRFYGRGNKEIATIIREFGALKDDENHTKAAKRGKTLLLIDIIAEYLKNFDEKIKSILKEEYRISTKKMNIKYVITVPAMWTETGKATMIEAAIKAGLVKNTQNRSLQLITEPEAAALSCENLMKKQLGDDFYKESLNFIVCDAGGGTVDLVTFSQVIEKNEDGEEFGTIRQIGNGTGGTCGAVHLNRNFRNLVEKFYTEVMGLKYEKDFIDHHMKYFDDNIKKSFMPNGKPNTTYEIELPGNSAIALGRLPMPYKEGSYDGHPYLPRCRLIKNNKFFEISYNDIREFVFDPVVNEAVKLLEKQIEKSKGFPLATVLMVGGFSQSKYLKMKIDECRKINNIPHVCESPNGVTDISRGAVSYFLEPRLVSKKVATASYAVCVESSDKKNARSHLAYFIRQSDSIEIEGEAYNKRVSVTYPGSAVIAIFSKENDEKPDSEDSNKSRNMLETFSSDVKGDIKKIAEYVIDLPEVPGIAHGSIVDLELSLKVSVGKVSLDVTSRTQGLTLRSSSQLEEESITFKRIETEPLKLGVTPENLGRLSLFSIFSSRR